MNSTDFKELDIESKVKYVNELLQQGDSVDNIRTTLGIGKNYIANTFAKGGYKLNRNINQYIKFDYYSFYNRKSVIIYRDKRIIRRGEGVRWLYFYY
jgi:hypothetical protein